MAIKLEGWRWVGGLNDLAISGGTFFTAFLTCKKIQLIRKQTWIRVKEIKINPRTKKKKKKIDSSENS